MKITMLHHTPIEPLIKATAMPYQSKETNGLVKRVFDSGHRSVVRHGMASFLIEGVSQSLLRQLSRHPHINLTVKSSRYCDMSDSQFYTPITELKNLEKILDRDLSNEYEEDMETIMNIYRKWKKYEGNEKEVDVSKMFLPLASDTDLIVSGNYQALYEFCQLRNCVRAETEIRLMSKEMTRQLSEVMDIFKTTDCKGVTYGVCPEHKSCGKYPVKE